MKTTTTTIDAPAKAYRRSRKNSTAYAGWLDGQPHVAYVLRGRTVIAGPVVCASRERAIEVCQQLQDLAMAGRRPANDRDHAHAAFGDMRGLLASSDYPC